MQTIIRLHWSIVNFKLYANLTKILSRNFLNKMDKNTYETYEYLSANSESDTDQFFVVQDDGTFLSKSV